jgi:[acyl-carrier-protein] S-malonyltransferase
MQIARERGARVLRLPISTPGHTPLMRDAALEFSRLMAALPFHDPNPPIVSNISARLLTTAEQVRKELADQICAAVQWARCVLAMERQGAGTFIEIGPGRALSKLVRRISDDARVLDADDVAASGLPEFAESAGPSRSAAR